MKLKKLMFCGILILLMIPSGCIGITKLRTEQRQKMMDCSKEDIRRSQHIRDALESKKLCLGASKIKVEALYGLPVTIKENFKFKGYYQQWCYYGDFCLIFKNGILESWCFLH